jgi:CubicO group peptidase (beta-lactamase class C family)
MEASCTFVPRLSRVAVLALSCMVLPALARAPETGPGLSAEVARYFDNCHAVRVCNGSFLVTQHGKVVYQAALGEADAETRIPLTPAHAFDIGSVSKQFTAAAVLRLAERGQLSLDGAAARYLPQLPYTDITLRQLLTHTSGVPDVFPLYTQRLKRGEVNTAMRGDEAVALLAEHQAPLSFAPGSAFEYSNTGYILLAQIVGRVSGMDYADFLQREFFAPLGMTHTRVRLPDNDALIQPRAWGFIVRPDGSRKAFDQIPNFYPVGPGGIYSTTQDLQRWAVALQQGRAMSKANWLLATTPATLSDGSKVPYGLGFKLVDSALGKPMVTHGGDWRGFKSDLTLLPEQGIQIVQLTNNAQDDSVEAARDAVEAILAGKPRPVLRTSIHWELYKQADALEAAQLSQWLDQQWAQAPRRYDFPGQPLEQVADDLLRRKAADKAVVVLEFNARIHPGSLDALDSLADAYRETGNRQAAIEQVQKMIALKPESRRLRQRLAQLQGE